MIFRKATEEDVSEIAKMYLALDETVKQFNTLSVSLPSMTSYENAVCYEIESPEKFGVFVGEDEDKTLTGFILLELGMTPYGLVICHVVELFVKDEYRRRGVGTGLLNTSRSWAEKMGCNTLTLNVYASNVSALDFYKKSGLVVNTYGLVETLGQKGGQ